MSRISDLGEACDEGIKTLKKLMETIKADARANEVRLGAATAAIHAYFKYSKPPDPTPDTEQ